MFLFISSKISIFQGRLVNSKSTLLEFNNFLKVSVPLYFENFTIKSKFVVVPTN
ncbi:hypothetical protein LEP1GSC082_2159 [Leptospira kirschneri str. H2]|nr:hypothetical protein LEP1GSC082_2159 [Leptospira kirschneri str. H2]